MRRRLLALPLAAWERDGLKAALVKAGLPADHVGDPRLLFWRFETHEDVPVGFGGLELHGTDARPAFGGDAAAAARAGHGGSHRGGARGRGARA